MWVGAKDISEAPLGHTSKTDVPLSLPIQGNGFTLRKFVATDAQALAEIEFDPKAKQFLAIPSKSRQKWIEHVRRIGIDGWAVEIQDGQFAGTASITRATPRRTGVAEIRIVLGRQFWGHGLGIKVAELLVSIAFVQLSAKAIVGVVNPENRASLKILRSLHFRRRGVVSNAFPAWQAGHLIYRLTRRAYNLNSVEVGS